MVAATATANSKSKAKETSYSWEGKDKSGKIIKGEMRAAGTVVVSSILRRQGINVTKIKRVWATGSITEKDITLFTRQLATMLKSGVPLLQAFDIVGKGHSNRAVGKLLMDIKTDVETGSNLASAFRKYPLYFDALFCNLVSAVEAAVILDSLLDRLATYKEKIQAIKGKIKSALFYPVSIIVVAFGITAVIMIFVIPAFKELFSGFGATLPTPTLIVMEISVHSAMKTAIRLFMVLVTLVVVLMAWVTPQLGNQKIHLLIIALVATSFALRDRKAGLTWGGGNIKASEATRGTKRKFLGR